MHGDILAESDKERGKLIGGLSLLSGYINKVRKEEENVIFAISGDMLQGSVIDTEYKGISTIEVMNYLSPDIVTLGNHEIDYGLPHLLFLERLANFPIVNANLYIKKYKKRLMQPYKILNLAGFDILFTGIITDAILDSLEMDPLIGSFISLEEASKEVGKICNAYKNDDIDLTVLLTHIGFDSDKKLASLLKEEWGVDMILGGHSHTVLDEPAKVNDVLIAQAGVGTNQIGRFDISVDDDTNSIVKYDWDLIPIDSSIAEPDKELEKFIMKYKSDVDRKYSKILCRLAAEHTHPKREIETSLGNIIADIFAQNAQCDVMFVGSGSIRVDQLGPLVTLKDLMKCFPYDDSLTKYTITGEQLIKTFSHIMRNENRNGEGECYQVSAGIEAKYDTKKDMLVSLSIKKEKVQPDSEYTICLQGFHFNQSKDNLNISKEDLIRNDKSKVVTTSAQEVLEENIKNMQNIQKKIEGRMLYI